MKTFKVILISAVVAVLVNLAMNITLSFYEKDINNIFNSLKGEKYILKIEYSSDAYKSLIKLKKKYKDISMISVVKEYTGNTLKEEEEIPGLDDHIIGRRNPKKTYSTTKEKRKFIHVGVFNSYNSAMDYARKVNYECHLQPEIVKVK